MSDASETRDSTRLRLAEELLTAEGLVAGDDSSPAEACARLLDRLYLLLRPMVGRGGFETLLGRAILVASRRHAGLSVLPVPREGPPSAEDLGRALEGAEDRRAGAAVSLVAELLSFLGRLVGWSLTLVLLREEWPDVAARHHASALENP